MRTHYTLSLLALVFGVAACSADGSVGPMPIGADLSTQQPGIASGPAPTRSTARYEIVFMTNMIDHHAMAVMMAEMCLEKAVHEELRELCEDIIAAQTREIRQMQTWLQQWYGVSYEPEMNRGAMRQMEKLASLSGADFEIAFMEMMIRHHEKAVQEGKQCFRRGSHEQLRELCENIAAQTAEIELMQSWLCDWYGMCN